MTLPTIYECASLIILAQESGGGAAPEAKPAEQPQGLFGGSWFLPIMLMMAVYLVVMLMFPKRGEQKKTQEMLDALKKNDRVLTSAGIKGTIVNISKESPWATIRIDESTNTKMQVLRSSISRVLTEDKKADDDVDK